MSKKIHGEDGKTYVEKKPFYKHYWFWIVVVILIIIGGSQMGNDSSNNSTSTKTVSTSEHSESSSKASSSSSNVPAEYKSALKKAREYATTMDMSKDGVYDQLSSSAGEDFSAEASQYAVDHLTNINWNKNALAKAKDYQDDQAMSPNSIREQLTSSAGEKFTPEQADYAIQHLND